MKVLLIYELIPEETHFYVLDNVNPNSELYSNLLIANGHYTNFVGEVGDNEGTEFLNLYLENQAKTLVSYNMDNLSIFGYCTLKQESDNGFSHTV